MALVAAGFWVSLAGGGVGDKGKARSILSGVMLGLAALIKPQIGLPFLALELLRRRWGALAAALTVGVAVGLIAVVPISMRGVPWWANWQANLSSFTHGNVGDPTAANSVRHQLLNLHYPLHAFVTDRTLVKVMVVGAVGWLAVVFFRFWILDFGFWILGSKGKAGGARSNAERADLLLSISMVSVLLLMVVYHRFYDGVLLLFPIAWVLTALARNRRDVLAWCMAVLLTPFFLNVATGLSILEKRAALPSWLLDEWWWNGVIMPVQAWALLALAVCLVLAGERERDGEKV